MIIIENLNEILYFNYNYEQVWKDWKADVKSKLSIEKKNLAATGGGPEVKVTSDYLDDQLSNIMDSNYDNVVLPPPETWEKRMLKSLLPDLPSTSGLKAKAKTVQVK